VDHVATDVHRQIAADRAGFGSAAWWRDQLAGTGDHTSLPDIATTGPLVMNSTKPAKTPLRCAPRNGFQPAHGCGTKSCLRPTSLKPLALEAAEISPTAPAGRHRLDGKEGAFDGP